MKIVGIVAEYNPFHLGHRWQIKEIRGRLGACTILCCMSGNWVQRGECAIADKWSRAAVALRGGADLVLELPTVLAVSSAECFARGAVGILAAAGVDTLAFGSESGDLVALQAAASALDSAEYAAALRPLLDGGMPFAAARQAAVGSILGTGADCLSSPNNNLAIEYLRAMPAGMDAIALPRMGAKHDGGIGSGFASASALRTLLRAGRGAAAAPYLSEPFAGEPSQPSLCERAILARLRGMTAADFARLPDCGAELAGRLVVAAQRGRTVEEVYTLAKTKRYTHARMRRLVLWAFLGLTAEDRRSAGGYLRVLGMNGAGKEHLARLKKGCPLPVITKPADAKGLLALEGKSTDLYSLCFSEVSVCGREFTQSPAVVTCPTYPTGT